MNCIIFSKVIISTTNMCVIKKVFMFMSWFNKWSNYFIFALIIIWYFKKERMEILVLKNYPVSWTSSFFIGIFLSQINMHISWIHTSTCYIYLTIQSYDTWEITISCVHRLRSVPNPFPHCIYLIVPLSICPFDRGNYSFVEIRCDRHHMKHT